MDTQNLPGIDYLNAKSAKTTVGKYYPHEMVEKLVKAAFLAGYRVGEYNRGYDLFPSDEELLERWFVGADIFSPEAWEDVP